MDKYIPPYNISETMLNYVSQIMEQIGEISSYINLNKKPELRKQNRINSIHSSLAIENNPLSKDEVKDIIDGTLVIGNKKDIQEVKNAYDSYLRINEINPYDLNDLKKIHKIMTYLTIEDNGNFRNHGECVRDGEKVIFVAPSEKMVPLLMQDLFDWINEAKKVVHPLILSSVFHYEFLFIHPFSDGNGRMARFWQTALLLNWKPIFEYLPIESLIKKYQTEYYDVIDKCNENGNSNLFIEFMLKMILETIKEVYIEQKHIIKQDIRTQILKMLRKKPEITLVEMSKELGMSREGIIYNLNKLKEEGIIRRTGSKRKGSWIVEK